MAASPKLGRRAADWLAGVLGRAPRADEPPPPTDSRPADAAGVRPAQSPVVQRLRGAFDTQAMEVEELRRLAHTDAVTGLPNRRHFVGRLAGALAEPGTPPASLLLMRVLQLHQLNQRLGHEATDHLLAAIADVLAAYPQRVPGAFAGRLNGSDFALSLPVSGVAEETAATLLGALRVSVANAAAGVDLVIGGVEALQAASAGEALAAADEALAQAEAAGPFCIEIRRGAADGESPALGERAWRQRIEAALAEDRANLGEYPVQDAQGRLIHLECPLRVQVEPGGPFLVAGRWLAMASRGRLLPVVDLAAIDLALNAIANDGRPRCVHVSAASLASAGFVGDVQRRLEAAPGACRSLWIDVAEGPSLDRSMPRLREASAAWRRHGVHLGLEHAGASMQALPRLGSIGLDHLKVGARYVRGAVSDAAVRQFAAGLVGLAHGMGWKIIAEGIDDPRDLAALWSLGFDGATGPAIGAEAPAA